MHHLTETDEAELPSITIVETQEFPFGYARQLSGVQFVAFLTFFRSLTEAQGRARRASSRLAA